MTIKQYNALRRRLYAAALEDPEIRAAMDGDTTGVVLVYDLQQLPDRHAVMICTRSTQVNAQTIAERGMDPERCDVRLALKLRRATGTAEL